MLTASERLVLNALFDSSEANAHVNGFLSDGDKAIDERNNLQEIIHSLVRKELISISDMPEGQFKLLRSPEEIIELL